MIYNKKTIFFFILYISTLSLKIIAINDTLENNTDGDLNVRVDYVSDAMPCTFSVFTVKKSEKINISSQSNQCKVQQIGITSISGSLSGKAYYETIDHALQKTSVVVTVRSDSNNRLNVAALMVDINSK